MSRYPKRPRDINQLGKLIVDIATGQKENDSPHDNPVYEDDPVREAKRQGGIKGAKSRADKFSPERRREIALKATEARWANQKA